MRINESKGSKASQERKCNCLGVCPVCTIGRTQPTLHWRSFRWGFLVQTLPTLNVAPDCQARRVPWPGFQAVHGCLLVVWCCLMFFDVGVVRFCSTLFHVVVWYCNSIMCCARSVLRHLSSKQIERLVKQSPRLQAVFQGAALAEVDMTSWMQQSSSFTLSGWCRVFMRKILLFLNRLVWKSHLREFPLLCGAHGPLWSACAGRDWDSFLYHCKWTSSLEAKKITLLRVIPTMTCWVKVVRWGLSGWIGTVIFPTRDKEPWRNPSHLFSGLLRALVVSCPPFSIAPGTNHAKSCQRRRRNMPNHVRTPPGKHISINRHQTWQYTSWSKVNIRCSNHKCLQCTIRSILCTKQAKSCQDTACQTNINNQASNMAAYPLKQSQKL